MVSAIIAASVTAILFLMAAYAGVYLPPYIHRYSDWLQPVFAISFVISMMLYTGRSGYSRAEWICLLAISGVMVTAGFLPEEWALPLLFPIIVGFAVLLARHALRSDHG
jgi:hypothetical protein